MSSKDSVSFHLPESLKLHVTDEIILWKGLKMWETFLLTLLSLGYLVVFYYLGE